MERGWVLSQVDTGKGKGKGKAEDFAGGKGKGKQPGSHGWDFGFRVQGSRLGGLGHACWGLSGLGGHLGSTSPNYRGR